MPKLPSLTEMLKAGVHFGHRTARWHPKMKPFIFGVRGGVHIIDIEQTQQKLQTAIDYMARVAGQGGTVVFLGTKKQLTDIVEKTATSANMPYINNRWLGGTFTNFSEIQKLIRQYLDLKDKRDKGDLKKYTKLEQLQFDRKIAELEEKIGGISTLKKLPEALFVFDARNEKTAILEAKKRGIKVIAICDTNVNPSMIDYVIPANDDSVGSLSLIGRIVADGITEGRNKKGKTTDASSDDDGSVEEEFQVSQTSKETVEDLDLEINEKLAKEREETIKN